MLVSPVLVFVRDFSANVILEYSSLIGILPDSLSGYTVLSAQ